MKVGIIGVGSIAQKHVTALKIIDPATTIYGLRSKKPSSQVEHVENVYELRELRHLGLDFLILSNPTSFRAEILEHVIAWKIPLFIEKPVLSSLEEGSKFINEISKSNVVTYVACNLRFLEAIQGVKKYIDSDSPRINEVNVYCGSHLPDWRPNRDYKTVYSAIPSQGGGVHLDLIHELDYIYWFFGKPERVDRHIRANSSLEIEAYDYANYRLIYSNFTVNVVLNYFRRDYKRTVEIVTVDDTILADLKTNTVTSICGSVMIESDRSILDTYESQLRYFCKLLPTNQDTSTDNFNDFSDGVEVLKIALADV